MTSAHTHMRGPSPTAKCPGPAVVVFPLTRCQLLAGARRQLRAQTSRRTGALTPTVSSLLQVDHFEEPHSCQSAAAWPSAPPLPLDNSVVSYSNGAVSLPSEGAAGSHRSVLLMAADSFFYHLCQMTLTVFAASRRQQ